MKRFAAIALATTALVGFGSGTVSADYPVDSPEITVSNAAPTTGANVTVEVDSFCPDTLVTFTITPPGSVIGTATTDGTGHASITFAAPAVGTYVIDATTDATCDMSEVLSLAVGALPPTGSSSSAGLQLGALVLGAGALLIGAAAIRRRNPATA